MTTSNSNIDECLAIEIQNVLDDVNPLVKSYRMARDRFQQNEQQDFKLRLIGRRAKDGRRYDLPTSEEVAALIVGDIGTTYDKRDVIVEKHSGQIRRISELHPLYLAMQYPLLLPYAEDGYRTDILHRELPNNGSRTKARTKVSMREFFAYKVQIRDGRFSLLLNSRKLYQQYLVDAYTMIEAERLSYIRNQQQKLRSADLSTINDAINQGNNDGSSIGKRVFLPSSFTGMFDIINLTFILIYGSI